MKNFSVNNFGVSFSASSPRDGASDVVWSMSHQREKKQSKKKKGANKYCKPHIATEA
jgi:hypothetical protein